MQPLPTSTCPTSPQAREWYRQDLVGQGIQDSGVPRESLFLVSKLHPRNLGRGAARKAFEATLADLKTDYLDVSRLSGTCRKGGARLPQAGSWPRDWPTPQPPIRPRPADAPDLLPCPCPALPPAAVADALPTLHSGGQQLQPLAGTRSVTRLVTCVAPLPCRRVWVQPLHAMCLRTARRRPSLAHYMLACAVPAWRLPGHLAGHVGGV